MDFIKSPPGYQQLAEVSDKPVQYQPSVNIVAPTAYQQQFEEMHLWSARHGTTVGLGPGLEPSFGGAGRWRLLRQPDGAVMFSCLWTPSLDSPLRIPSPSLLPLAFLAARPDGSVSAVLAPTTDCLFRIEPDPSGSGSVALRSLATGGLCAAESHGISATRAVMRHWETFRLDPIPPASALSMPLPALDPLATGMVSARVRIGSARYGGKLVGLRGQRGKVKFTRRDSDWDILADGTGCVLIRNVSHPNVFWNCVLGQNHNYVTAGQHQAGMGNRFILERCQEGYAFRSAASNFYAVALCNGIVCNRDKKKLWERFHITVLQQLQVQ